MGDWLHTPDEVHCVVCPDCAFTFDYVHRDVDGGYSCPHCAENRLGSEVDRLRERDAAAQILIGLLRYHLSHYHHEAGGCDFPPYRAWKALSPVATEGPA